MTHKHNTNYESHNKKYGSKATAAQLLATLVHSFQFFGLGMNLSIIPLVIFNLYQKSSIYNKFSISLAETSWYGSFLYLAYPIGCVFAAIIQESMGKKVCMVLANIPGIIAWLMLYYAYSSSSLHISAILMGINSGFGAGSTFSFVGEITEPRLRGSLSSISAAAVRMGQLLTFVTGMFFEWRTVALLNALCPLTCMFLIVFIPEPPIWLVSKGKIEKAEKSLCWLRGWVKPESVNTELHELIAYNEMSGSQERKAEIDQNKDDLVSKFSEFKNPSVYKPFFLMMIMVFISFISCIYPMKPFITKILTDVKLLKNQNLFLINLAALTCFGSIVLTVTIHRVGKRFLAILTLTINTVLLFLFGAYVIVVKNNYIDPKPWIPLTIISIIYFVGDSGISNVPWILLNEIFPNKSRGFATSVCSSLAFILLFFVVKIYLSLELLLSLEYTLILFGCIGLCGLFYIYFYLPETENKTFLEIEEFFVSNSKCNKSNI